MKTTRSFCLDLDVYEWLKTRGNMSIYITELIVREMKAEINKKEPQKIDLDGALDDVLNAEIQKENKEKEKLDRIAAWDSISPEFQEMIKQKDNWGKLWHNVIYPIFKKQGSLTVEDIQNAKEA